MALMIQQTPEGIFHGPGRLGINVAFHSRQVKDILPDEVIWNSDPLGINVVQGQHGRLGLIGYPLHTLRFEIEKHRNIISLKDRSIQVKAFAFMGLSHLSLVLHT